MAVFTIKTHSQHLLKQMKQGLVFRKYDIKTAEEMKRQTFKFIAEVVKKSQANEAVRFNVEKDPHCTKHFHSHIIFIDPSLDVIKSVSERVLKASEWVKQFTPDSDFYDFIEVLKSRFGEVRIHEVREEKGFLMYCNGEKKQKVIELEIYLPLHMYKNQLKFK